MYLSFLPPPPPPLPPLRSFLSRGDEKRFTPSPSNNYSGIRHFCHRIKRFEDDYQPMIDRWTRENRARTERLIGWNAVGTVFCTLVTLRGNGGAAEREGR